MARVFPRISAALSGLVLACGLVAGAQTPERAAATGSQEEMVLRELRAEAEAGSSRAQFELGEAYDSGKRVTRSTTEAFKWWLKAAEQGHRTAQHNVAVAYLTGAGVQRNKEEAIRWFTKAAEQGDEQAGQYARRLKQGQSAARMVRVDPQLSARPAASQQPLTTANSPALANAAAAANTEREGLLRRIVAQYHQDHTYVGNDIYECVDMASDVWNQVLTKGIEAKVMIGNLKKQMEKVADADHAWVLAEVARGQMVALEATAGTLVYARENPRYFQGHAFSTPKEVREFQALKRDHNEAVKKFNVAADAYNQAVTNYENSTWLARGELKLDLEKKQAIVAERNTDVEELKAKLNALLDKK